MGVMIEYYWFFFLQDIIIFSFFNDLLRIGGRFNRNVKIYIFDGEDVMLSFKW